MYQEIRSMRFLSAALAVAGVAFLCHRAHAGAPRVRRRVRREQAVHFPEAVVTKVELINPHSWIHVDVKNADGTVENWAIEAGSPNVLLRRGITRDTLKPGDKIVIDGYQSKDGSHRANGRDLKLPNGQQLFLGNSGEGAPYEVQRPASTRRNRWHRLPPVTFGGRSVSLRRFSSPICHARVNPPKH